MRMKGVFIVFEGGEFSGKTTQAKRFAQYLKEKGFDAILTREPGGTPEGQKIRERLLHEKLTAWEELDLFFEDRRIHVAKIIKPSLREGKIVISDRFSPSTIAYQGGGRGLDQELISEKDYAARNGIWPDKIILLDGDPEKLRERAAGRGEKLANFENLGFDFHSRVRESFLKQARENPNTWCVINALRSIEHVFQEVKACVAVLESVNLG